MIHGVEIESQIQAPAAPPSMSSPVPVSQAPSSTIVCHCFQISEREILDAIHNGAASVHEVLAATSATSACGGCSLQVERMLLGLPPSVFQCSHCGSSSLLCDCGTSWMNR